MAENNKDALFVIAIGGTGMRCLESFVHLCAIGMLDGREVNILTLDTDSMNGNKSRVQSLINTYNAIKRDASGAEGLPQSKTFFSAKLNFYEFTTNYEGTGRNTYKSLSEQATGISEVDKRENQDLSDLFLDHDTVQQFSLLEGYRAQTHLGSLLMYHGIVEAALVCKRDINHASPQQVALSKYLDALKEANAAGAGRVFVFGSVFGGTGASSIPIIPKALQEAVRVKSVNGTETLDFAQRIKCGATLLTQYFTFAQVNADSLAAQRVIANSDNFAINSQAALQFYSDDETVNNTYKRLYHVGWPFERVFFGSDNKTEVGGGDQRNDCHVVELMSACAALEFFTEPKESLENKEAVYLFKSVEEHHPGDSAGVAHTHYKFTEDFFLGGMGDVFRRRLGAMTSLALLVLAHQQAACKKIENSSPSELIGVTLFTRSKEGKPIFTDSDLHYSDLNNDLNALEKIDDYLRMFAYHYEGTKLVRGWLFQIYESLKLVNGDFFIHPQCFTTEYLDMNRPVVDMGEVFTNVEHNFYQGRTMFGNKRDTPSHQKSFEIFERNCKNMSSKPTIEQSARSNMEKLIAHVYNALMMSQN